ncbi:hypothetical protein B0A55_07572 [Friedmanniomyces simplex]|uniref:Uncharacterized protein n=1 Tax=Friedmanniomyces simplex TaxID=329884 RepID=A0A4U0X7Y2_9PEZI|nr:hypothetical protein B0A55_07572 [Friedmanniomyces simplex]
MVTKIELRVHAGAPSSRRDDDRYRALAEAYLNFTGQIVSQGDDSTQNEASNAAQVPQSDSPQDEAMDDSISILRYDETTYVEDTQLAYDALESQLQTSSLTIPDVTPLKRPLPHDFGEDSPWPENLDRHSPCAAKSSPALNGPSLHQSDSPASEGDAPRTTLEPPTPVLHRPVKKLRLQRRVPAAPVFKPFRSPLKRAASDQIRAITPETRTLDPQAGRLGVSESDQGFSQSSYLKTPMLVTPEQGWRARTEKRGTTAFQTRQAVKPPLLDDVDELTALGKPTRAQPGNQPNIPDYRERTPQRKPLVPYMPLPEGSPATGQHPLQLSSSAPDTTSELPTSYSLSDITSQSSRARLRNSQRSASDPGPIGDTSIGGSLEVSVRSSSQPARVERVTGTHDVVGKPTRSRPLKRSPQALDRGDREPRPKATDAIAPAGKRTPAKGLDISPLIDVPKPAERDSTLPGPAHLVVPSFDDLPLALHSPEPAVSIEKLVTHVTPALEWLAGERSVVKDCYNPVLVSRTVRSLERGYWLVDTSTWSHQLQHDFWRFLKNQVESGDAGWGVWCMREPGASGRSPPDQRFGGLGKVKVFCWGEIVKHIYLMLYAASNSKVRKAGLQWVDAGEEVVVQMRSGET